MSERLAGTLEVKSVAFPRAAFLRFVPREVVMNTDKREWRQLSEVVSNVLRDVRKVPAAKPAGLVEPLKIQ
ncbi:MAG: hypothetical protein ABL907_05330 [Hyphomicrobium sp.]